MQKLIKDNAIVEDYWTILKEASNPKVLSIIPGKNMIIPLSLWRDYPEEVSDYIGKIAVWVNSDESVYDIGEQLHDLPLIALNFPAFSDGRSYSKARELREVLNYKGEVRAIGDILRDQLFYLSRCGFDAFTLRYDQDWDASLAALTDFSNSYQGTVAQPKPLFRRR